MLPNMIPVCLLLLMTLTSVVDEGLAVEEGTVQQPTMFIDVEILRKPLTEEWSEEMCAGELDINGCIDKTEEKAIKKIQNKAWRKKLKAKWRARKTKWQKRVNKLRKMIRNRQNNKPKKTKDLIKEKRKETTWAWKMLQAILKGRKSIMQVKRTIGKKTLRKMKSERRKGKRWAWRMLLALLEGRKTISQVKDVIKNQKLKKLQSADGEEVNEEKTVEDADHLQKLEEEECKGVTDSKACKKVMEKINDGKKTTWAWKMLQAILKGKKSISQIKKTIGKQKLRQMKSEKGKRKRWAWRMLLALLEGRNTISQVREIVIKQKLKKLQSADGEEVNEEKTVEEADHLEKLEEEECKGVTDSKACKKVMEKINDGKKTTWAWKMLQAILKGKKSISQIKKTIGKQKLRQMKSEKGRRKRWAWRMLLALLEGRKTISQVREIIIKQKLKKLQSADGEEVNEEKTVEEADHLEKLEEEVCKGVSDSKACDNEMEKINDGKKTTWAWKMLQAILKGDKSIAQVKETIGKKKLRQMKSEKGRRKRWAWRMLLALLEGRKTISRVRETIGNQKLKRLQSADGEEVNGEKTVEDADHLEKLEEEECKGVPNSEACKKEMEKINDGKKTTWAWKMLQAILKGTKSIWQVKKTIGKQKLRQMKSEKRKGNSWASRMLLALLEGTKTISQVRKVIKKQKSKKLQSQNGEEVNEENTVEEAGLLEKLEEEECKGVANSEACKKEMEKINDGEKTTWAWKMLQTILKGKKTITQVKKTIGKRKMRKMKTERREGKRWDWRLLLALLERTKTISEVREAIKKQKVIEERTAEEAGILAKLKEGECKGVADSGACQKEMKEINGGKTTTWAWKVLQTILKGRKSIEQVKKTIGKEKLRQMKSEKRRGKRWAWRMLMALLEGRKSISQVKQVIKNQKLKKLQSVDGEEVNEEKTVEDADHLQKLEEEECKGVTDSKACKKVMEKINDGKKTTWAWKMLQAILKGTKSIAQVKKTIGKQKLRQMKSEKRKGNRWAWRMLLALLEGRKSISQVREAMKKQKLGKLQSVDGEELNEEKTVEEADKLEKLQEEECKGLADRQACKKEMEKVNDGKKTTWAWKVLQTILKGRKSIAEVMETIGKQKLRKMKSEKRKEKRWAWRMLLALLEGRKTISQVREAIKKQKMKKLQSADGEEVNEEKTVEDADQLEKLQEEECRGVADIEACKKEMKEINDGKKTTWAWKMLLTILKGEKTIVQVKKIIGKQRLRQMKLVKGRRKIWGWRMLLALLEGTKTVSQVKSKLGHKRFKKLLSQNGKDVSAEKTVEDAVDLEKLQEEECKGVEDSEACKTRMEKINDGKKTTWEWKMLQTILKGRKSIAQVKKTIGKQKLRKMKSDNRKGKRLAWRMLLAMLEGRKTISQVREAIKKQKLKKLQSADGEEVNEEKTVEEADQLQKLEEEECKGITDSKACKKVMEKINDGKKTTWAWKMLQAILKGTKSIVQVKKTIGNKKLIKMKSEKRKEKRWAWRMLLALLEGRKTISQVREAIKRQKVKKLQSADGEEVNEEKIVEEANHLEKLEEEECKGVSDSKACENQMEKINDGKKTTWAWKMLQAILKGDKSIAQVKKTIGKQKLRQMKSEKGRRKRWAWRMLLALLEGRKTISQVRKTIGDQKLKRLQSADGEDVNEEKTVEEADHLEKLEEEECKGVPKSEACKKKMEKINDGKKTTWAWKMLQAILKGTKSIWQVKKTIGKQKLRRMKSEKRKGNSWASRMLLALLEGTKTISQVRKVIKKQKSKKLQSQNGEEVNEENTVEEADLLEKLEEEECKGVANSEACKKEMEKINDGEKTTWAWKMLQTILKGKKTITQVKKPIGKRKMRKMKSERREGKRWDWRLLLALLERTKTISEVREAIKKQKVIEERTTEEAGILSKLKEGECKGVADSGACQKEMKEINGGKKTTWAWKVLQTILKGRKSIEQVKKTIGKKKLRQMKSEKRRGKRWAWRMLMALLEGRKTISQVKQAIKNQKLKKLQSADGEEVNEEKTVEEADQLQKLEEEECKGITDSKACKKVMEKINDGKKTTWAWKMLQAILKGTKSIVQVKKTIGKKKLIKMKSEKRKEKRWAWRMLLALLEGRKTISQVREAMKKQKLGKLQSADGEEINEEKTVEEADKLEKLQVEECKGLADRQACKKEMEKINDGKKTTWAWKVLQTILKGRKSIAEVMETIGKQKLRKMKSGKRKEKRWAWRMLLALLEGRKTISQVREAIKKQKLKKLQSVDGEEVNEEKTVEEADQLQKLEEEECKGVTDSKACKKVMEKINDGKKTTWAWKMLQAILKGTKSLLQVKKTIGKQKLIKMKSEKKKEKRWAWRMLLALLEGRKTISQVREAIKKQKLKKMQSADGEEVNEEKTVEGADQLEKLQEEECRGVADIEACKKEMKEINDGKKTTWAWKMLLTILKGERTIEQVKKIIGKQRLRQMKLVKGRRKRWGWRMLLALLEGTKTVSQVKSKLGHKRFKNLLSQNGKDVSAEKTVEDAVDLEKLQEEECMGVADSKGCKKEIEMINDGEKTTWAWKMLQTILKGTKTISQVKKIIGKQKLRQMKSEKGRRKRWSWRMLQALLDGTKTISQVRKLKVSSETGAEIAEECKGSSNVDACVKKNKKAKDNRKTRPSWGLNIIKKIVNKFREKRKNSARGNRKNAAQRNRKKSAERNRKNSARGNRNNLGPGHGKNSALGKRKNSAKGNRKKSVQRNRMNSAERNRKNSVVEIKKKSAQGNRKNSANGNRKKSAERNRKNSVVEKRENSAQGNRKNFAQGNGKSTSEGNRKKSAEGNRKKSAGRNRKNSVVENKEKSAQGNIKNSAQGNRRRSSGGNTKNSARGNRKNLGPGNGKNSALGKRKNSAKGNRKKPVQRNRMNSAEGNRKNSVVEIKKKSAQGNRKNSANGNRKKSAERNRKNSVVEKRENSAQGNRKNFAQGDGKSTSEGNRKKSAKGNRKKSAGRNRKNSVVENKEKSAQGNRKNSAQGNRRRSSGGNTKNSARGKGKNSAPGRRKY